MTTGSEMTPQQILEKALKKARANGYFIGFGADEDDIKLAEHAKFIAETGTYIQIIFNKKFCQALWGEQIWLCYLGPKVKEPGDSAGFGWTRLPAWQSRIFGMVTANDPIAFLAQWMYFAGLISHDDAIAYLDKNT